MKTVYAYVVADLLHYGHIRYLERARKHGDRLIVGILSEPACMEKKPKPVMSISERFAAVKALRCVNKVVLQHTYSPLDNVKSLKPDVLAESVDHRGLDYLAGVTNYCKNNNIEIVTLPYTEGISSTKIKERIVNAHEKNERY